MQRPVETIQFRVTTRDLMDVKDCHSLYDTRSAIKFMFEQQYPTKELLLEKGFSSDPCSINSDAVIVTVQARSK